MVDSRIRKDLDSGNLLELNRVVVSADKLHLADYLADLGPERRSDTPTSSWHLLKIAHQDIR